MWWSTYWVRDKRLNSNWGPSDEKTVSLYMHYPKLPHSLLSSFAGLPLEIPLYIVNADSNSGPLDYFTVSIYTEQ